LVLTTIGNSRFQVQKNFRFTETVHSSVIGLARLEWARRVVAVALRLLVCTGLFVLIFRKGRLDFMAGCTNIGAIALLL
jgi:hypothetical protein